MKLPASAWSCVAILLAVAAACPAVSAQQPQPVRPKPRYRKLAPGVMLSVDPARELGESFSRHDVVELLAENPEFGWAKDVPFRHNIWALEFRFKPVRMMWVDIPQKGGVMDRKLVWYLVYSVRNPGKVMVPVEEAELPYQTFEGKKMFQVKTVDEPIRFVPQFLLEGRKDLSKDNAQNLVYKDRVIPVAVAQIRMREDPYRRFFNSAEISQGRIAVGKTAWGIATWVDVDPLIDRFSVYVKGLTNAYKWKDDPTKYQKGAPLDGYRKFWHKTLKLNFWRPGDERYQHEREIRVGLPRHDVPGFGPVQPDKVYYEWVYR